MLKLSDHFTGFRRAMRLDECKPEHALFIQGSYVAGAQAAVQILAAANDLPTKEETAQVWADLWKEIMAATPKASEPVEEKRIVTLN
jgi:glycogen debranching enzyme